MRNLGFPEFNPPVQMNPILSFLAMPIRRRGQSLGTIYLADKKKGQEFSSEDEDALAMFASQAAVVIASARRGRTGRCPSRSIAAYRKTR